MHVHNLNILHRCMLADLPSRIRRKSNRLHECCSSHPRCGPVGAVCLTCLAVCLRQSPTCLHIFDNSLVFGSASFTCFDCFIPIVLLFLRIYFLTKPYTQSPLFGFVCSLVLAQAHCPETSSKMAYKPRWNARLWFALQRNFTQDQSLLEQEHSAYSTLIFHLSSLIEDVEP